MAEENFFPSIGTVATETDHAVDTANEQGMHSVESLCMKCGEQGTTRLLLTTIPYFREVIIVSFRCTHCGTSNNEIQSASEIRPSGIIYTTSITNTLDLNRQIVRSPTCAVHIKEFQLSMPAIQLDIFGKEEGQARGVLTTVEGLVRDIIKDLGGDQVLRRIQDEESWIKIESLLAQLRLIVGEDEDTDDQSAPKKEEDPNRTFPPFTVTLDDPAGNSFIEFLTETTLHPVDGSASALLAADPHIADPKWAMKTYERTRAQEIALGLIADDQAESSADASADLAKVAEEQDDEIGGGAEGTNEEIYTFPGTCSSCGQPLDTLMKRVFIPYFKDILIMSTNCPHCGYRDNEVKSGSAISPLGKRITLRVEDKEDLGRDVLKSESASLHIPSLDLDLQQGTLGGRFTTLEGILEQVYSELREKVFIGGYGGGDSAQPSEKDAATEQADEKKKFEAFLAKLELIKAAAHPFTIIIDDPLANSYIQNLYAPDPDPGLTIETYERTYEQDEELGLNDIKVEGYEEDAAIAKAAEDKKEVSGAQAHP